MSKLRIRNVVLTITAIAAALFLVATYGTALPSLPFASVPLNGPITANSDGNMTVIADTDSRRALILNADGDLTGVVDCQTMDSPIEAITGVCVSGEYVYLTGAKYAPDSTMVELERVAVYDKGGNLEGSPYELKGGELGNSQIKGISPAEGGVVICINSSSVNMSSGTAKQDLSFQYVSFDENHSIKTDGTEQFDVFDITYSAKTDSYAMLSFRGFINDSAGKKELAFPGHVFTAIGLSDSGVLYACDDVTGGICEISSDGNVRMFAEGTGYNDVSVNKDVVCFNDWDANTVELRNVNGTAIASFATVVPSIGFSLRMLIVWICAIYLAALALVFIVRKVRRAIKAGQTKSIGAMFAAFAVVMAFGVAIGVLSDASYQTALDRRSNEINMCADYLTFEARSLGPSIELFSDRNAFREGDEKLEESVRALVSASANVSSLVMAANENDIGLYFTLYGKDEKGLFYIFDSENEHIMGTSVPSSMSEGVLGDAFVSNSGEKSPLYEGRSLRDATKYRLVSIPKSDESGIAGVIEIGSKVRAFDTLIANIQAQRLLALLVIMLVVYLAYSEIRASARCLYAYRRLQERRAHDAVAVLTRPFTLSITMLTSIDSVMTVLIARDLLGRAGMDQSSPLLAVPAIMLGIGLIIGQLLYGILGARVGLRRLISTGAFVMMLCSVFTVAAVGWGGFWLYCAAKLVMSVPFGLLYTLGYSLPRIADSDETRKVAAGGVKRTDVSAAALGTVLGGYAAQTLGNEWVYVIVAIACIPVILMALNLLPKGAAPLEQRSAASDNARALLRFVKGKNALSLALLIILPVTIATGYTSFLFPLFSVDLGLDKAQINNFFVLGQLIVYICINSIEGLESRRGRWRVSLVAMALLGAVFLLFSFNATLVWSIVVVAFVGILCKAADGGWKAMWQYSANEAGVSLGRATGAMFATRSLALIVQPFILGGLLNATDAVAVIVIGAICVLCAASFFFITRRGSLPSMK